MCFTNNAVVEMRSKYMLVSNQNLYFILLKILKIEKENKGLSSSAFYRMVAQNIAPRLIFNMAS